MPDTAGLQPDTAGHTGHDRTHRTRPDTTGQYSRTLPDRDTRGAVQNEPDNTGHRTDKPDSIPDSIPDSSGQRTGQRTGHSPDTHRTQPDTPDNRTPTAQPGAPVRGDSEPGWGSETVARGAPLRTGACPGVIESGTVLVWSIPCSIHT